MYSLQTSQYAESGGFTDLYLPPVRFPRDSRAFLSNIRCPVQLRPESNLGNKSPGHHVKSEFRDEQEKVACLTENLKFRFTRQPCLEHFTRCRVKSSTSDLLDEDRIFGGAPGRLLSARESPGVLFSGLSDPGHEGRWDGAGRYLSVGQSSSGASRRL